MTTKAPSRPISYTTYTTTDSSSVAVTELARGSIEIDTAWLLAFEAAAYVDEVGAGAPRDVLVEARICGMCGYLTELLCTGVDRLLNVGGAGSFGIPKRDTTDVARSQRRQPTRLLATNPPLETYGRSVLGLEPILFIV